TAEPERLEAKPVEVLSVVLEEVGIKKSPKVIFKCRHPDKTGEVIDISSVIYINKDKRVGESGTWFNTDKDGLLNKYSALAALIKKYKVSSARALAGQTLETEMNSAGYLALKAY